MKVLLFAILFMIQTIVNGQSMPSDSLSRWVYCEIVGMQKMFSGELNVTVDYGQQVGWFSDQRIRDEKGKVKSFNSMVDAMNYLGANGWEFLQAYTVTSGNSNVYHWLLRADLHNPVFIPQTKKQ